MRGGVEAAVCEDSAHGLNPRSSSALHSSDLGSSEEERLHQLKFYKYVLDMGGVAISPEITNIKNDFNSFREVFEEALEQEVNITQSIKNIAARCYKESDFVTLEFLRLKSRLVLSPLSKRS